MSSLPSDLQKNDRYFLAILGASILAMLLACYKELSPWLQERFIPAYVVYLVGTALLAQVQNMTGIRRRRLQEARCEPFTGTWPVVFWCIVALHMTWFVLWVLYLFRVGLAGESAPWSSMLLRA